MKLLLASLPLLATSDSDSFGSTSDPHSLGSCAEGQCDHGTGVFEYNNGDVYYGEFAGYHRHGNGIMSYNRTGRPEKAPKKYDGEWQIDMFSGRGRLELIGGTLEKGMFQNGVLHGLGRRTYKNGSWIDGSFVGGVPNGRCASIDTDLHETSYIGDWLEGIWHGQGLLEREDGFQHNGTFVLGAMTGHARRKYPAIEDEEEDEEEAQQHDAVVRREQDWYEGAFVNGKREGKGTYHVHVDAKKWWEFVGMFVNDEIKGEGTMTRSNGSQRPIDWKVKTAIFPLKEVWTWEEDPESEPEPSLLVSEEKLGVDATAEDGIFEIPPEINIENVEVVIDDDDESVEEEEEANADKKIKI